MSSLMGRLSRARVMGAGYCYWMPAVGAVLVADGHWTPPSVVLIVAASRRQSRRFHVVQSVSLNISTIRRNQRDIQRKVSISRFSSKNHEILRFLTSHRAR